MGVKKKKSTGLYYANTLVFFPRLGDSLPQVSWPAFSTTQIHYIILSSCLPSEKEKANAIQAEETYWTGYCN